jgi:hypothetical protein
LLKGEEGKEALGAQGKADRLAVALELKALQKG